MGTSFDYNSLNPIPLQATPEQIWEYLCDLNPEESMLDTAVTLFMLDHIKSWAVQFSPWEGVAFIREAMPRNEYYFTLLCFFHAAKKAGDI